MDDTGSPWATPCAALGGGIITLSIEGETAMKRNQLLDLFIQSQLQQAKMPSIHFDYQRVNGKVVVTFSGEVAMAHADSLAMQFFPIEKQLNVDFFRLTSKGAAFGISKKTASLKSCAPKKVVASSPAKMLPLHAF